MFSEEDARVVVALGLIQLVAGVLSIIFQSAATSVQGRFYATIGRAESAGAGIWCGSVETIVLLSISSDTNFLLAGILGVSAGKRNSFGLIFSSTVFSILASILVWVQIGFEIGQLELLSSSRNITVSYSALSSSIGYYKYAYLLGTRPTYLDYYYYGPFDNYFTSYYSFIEKSPVYVTSYSTAYVAKQIDLSSPHYRTWRAMNSMLLILAVLECAVAIAASTYCCKAQGCCPTQPPCFQVIRQTIPPPQASARVQGQSTLPTSANQGSANHSSALLSDGVLRTEDFDLPPNYGSLATAAPYGLLANVPAGPSNHGTGLTSAGLGPPLPRSYYMQVEVGASSEFTNLAFAPPSYEDVLNEDL